MRRRGDEPHARCGMANLRNPWIDLVARKLSAFPRLGALGPFDLQFLLLTQVFAGHTEACRRHLLDGTVPRVAVGIQDVSGWILTAFSGVALAADAIHRDSKRLMGLFTDGPVRHRPRFEPLHNGL